MDERLKKQIMAMVYQEGKDYAVNRLTDQAGLDPEMASMCVNAIAQAMGVNDEQPE